MKKTLLCIVLLSMMATVTHAAPVATLTRVNPLDKILLEDAYFAEYDETEEVARGETANYQLAFRAEAAASDLQVSVSPFRDDRGNTLSGTVDKGFESYVHNGKFAWKGIPDRIVPPSRMYPDPILDDRLAALAAKTNQPVWISVDIDRTATPGMYHATATVTATIDGRCVSLQCPLTLKVYPVTMEEPQLWMDNWFYVGGREFRLLNEGTDVDYGSPLYWHYTRLLAERLRRVYNNVTRVSALWNADIDYADGRYTFDYTRFDQQVDSFRAYGILKRLDVDGLGTRLKDGVHDSPFILFVPVKVDGKMRTECLPFSDPRSQDFLRQYVTSLTAHMRERFPGLDYAQELFDEPNGTNSDSYIEAAHFIKNVAPDLKLLQAVECTDLDNLVSVWVPQLTYMKDMLNFMHRRQHAGDEAWFYTCLYPQGRFANRLLEQQLVKTRLLHWINYRYGLTGYLHWGFNCWGQWSNDDPLYFQGCGSLPGGDECIVYPYRKHIYGSIRLEEMRRGVQDYTLLSQLAKKDKPLADKISASIIHDWDRYDLSSSALRRARHELLEALK